MDDLKQIFNKEIDPSIIDANRSKKQQKGFTPTGIKGLHLIEKNLIQIYEIESSVDYTMEVFNFTRIIDVMGFDEDKLKLGLSKLYANYYLILDFDTKKILMYDNKEKMQLIGQDLTNAKQVHTNKEDDDIYYDKEVYSDWYKEITGD